MRPDPRRLSLAGATLVAVVVFVVRALPTWGTVVDDAYITARYAEHLAAGHGLVYNAGEPAVEGYTNLAWTVLLAGTRVLGMPVHSTMEGLGLLFGALAIVGLAFLADAIMGRPRQGWLAAVPALLAALTPHLAVVATNGLETTQFVAASIWAIWAAWVSRGAWRWGAAVLVGGLCLIRPEGALVAGGIVLIDLIERRDQLRSAHTWAPLIVLAVTLVGLETWRYATYGALWPNTGPAKANLSWQGAFRLNRRYLGGDAEVWIGALVLMLAGVAASRWTWRKLLLVCLVSGLVLIASRVYLWMPGARLLVLPLLLAFTLASLPLAEPERLRRGVRIGWGVLLGLAGFWLVIGDPTGLVPKGGDPTAFHRKRDRHHSVVSPNPTRIAGEHLAAHLPAGSRLATRDAGLLAWSVGTDVRVDELHPRALTLPHPDYADVDWKALLDEPPEVVVFTVNSATRKPFYYALEGRIWRHIAPARYHYLGRIEQHHRRHYDIYVRDDLDVPPLPAEILTNHEGRLPRTTVVEGVKGE